jgi:AraC-like DNA-binding protein
LERAPDIERFLRAPIGRYVQGDGWLCFYATPHLSGVVIWGMVVASEVARAMTIPPAMHRCGTPPRVGLIDARRVEKVEPDAFQVAARYVIEHQATIASLIERVAILHAPGLMSSVADGFFSMVGPQYEVRTFTDSAEAVQWLAVPDASGVLGEVDRICASVEEGALRRELGMLLSRALHEPEPPRGVAAYAKALGLSVRSLQRRLGEAGTSFRQELALARVARAQELLSTTKLSIAEVGFQVGCSSEQQFSHLFRRITGESPARWRKSAAP